MTYLIRPSVISDVYALAGSLRREDRLEVTCLGFDVRAAIRASYRHAFLRRTAEIDGQVAAMWGCAGALLCDEGEPYLMTAPIIEKMPVSFVKEARASVVDMLQHRDRLVGHVAASYERACRFLHVLGFTLSEPFPLGPNGAMFRRFEMVR